MKKVLFIAWCVGLLSAGCGGGNEASRPGQCGDGVDNDGDLQIDCVDVDCVGTPECTDPTPTPSPTPTATPIHTPTEQCHTPTPVNTPTPVPSYPGPCSSNCTSVNGYNLDAWINIIDDCDGTYSAWGWWRFNETFDNNIRCTEEMEFIAELDINGSYPCPNAGTGSCIGRLVNPMVLPNTYRSNCAHVFPDDWFRPATMEDWLSRLMFSYPVDPAVQLGPYCGGCTTNTIGTVAAPLAGTGFIADHTVWMEWFDGFTIMPLALLIEEDPEGDGATDPLGVGEHQFAFFWNFLVN
jgi:hypothetical protein